MLDVNRYIETVIHWDDMNNDFGGVYRLVSQRPYRGKAEAGLAPGVTVTLQVIEDKADPIVVKSTGKPKENNVFETFEATIVGLSYPVSFKKGDYVALDGFMPEASYYIDFTPILRFQALKAAAAPKPTQPQQVQGGKS